MSVPSRSTRQRTDDFLVARFGRASGPPTTVLDALSAAGLLAGEDRRRWESAFATGDLPAMRPLPLATSDAEAKRRSHALVARRVAAGAERVFGVLDALREVGLFSDEEVWAWQRELIHSEAAWSTPPDQGRPAFRADNLARVIIGAPERRRGVRVIAVEVYDDGVVVRWHLVRGEAARDGGARELPDEVEPVERPLPPNFRLSDDIGTSYSRAGGGSRGRETDAGDFVAFGTAQFTAGVPPQAARLRMESRGTVFEVALP